MLPDYLCKIVSIDNYEKSLSQEHLALSAMDDEFIHFSTKEQVLRVIGKFYPKDTVMILYVDPTLLVGDLRYETNPGGSEKYYHLYNGHIPMSSVKSTYRFEPVTTK